MPNLNHLEKSQQQKAAVSDEKSARVSEGVLALLSIFLFSSTRITIVDDASALRTLRTSFAASFSR